MPHDRLQALRSAPLPRSEQVLLLVDVINPMDFPAADDLLPHAWEAAQRVARLKKKLAAQGTVVVYANDNYGTWHSEFRDILAACQTQPGERGAIARLLTPTPDDLVILKPQHSAFHSTPLRHLLTQMHTRRLVIAGWAADMCVMLSATDARMLGYDVWVPRDCIAAETPERYDLAVRQLGGPFDCSVRAAFRARASR
ncbi:Nicotinamidase-related amidase [Oryzisolibacter propanilivorax]|uniref:Nicotinamidase-related amidase n=1 Tax=Oryzisolibacter propanilivorax TaxID=1527607 RepID=A0A1G9RLK6_9BURK|nr:isochorismatase family cysteine hydrolase [Oryzisolibacter propanilivorax]SDM24104.1 Nicotinamidase-related amidase [Oryzisolibacter propanilivorax]